MIHNKINLISSGCPRRSIAWQCNIMTLNTILFPACLESDCDFSAGVGDLYEEAADDAMACMKGKKANLYYAQAEEARALIEE